MSRYCAPWRLMSGPELARDMIVLFLSVLRQNGVARPGRMNGLVTWYRWDNSGSIELQNLPAGYSSQYAVMCLLLNDFKPVPDRVPSDS